MKPESKFIQVLTKASKLALPASPITVVHRLISKCKKRDIERISVLDIGFGYGLHWGTSPKHLYPYVSITALDAVPITLNEVGFMPDHEIVGVVPDALRGIPDNSFDLVMAFDIIEHLPRHDGYLLIYEMQRISKHFSVIFTPNGLVWQPPLEGNPFQAHVSGWTPSELAKVGFRTLRGMRGLRWLYGPMARRKIWPESKIISGLLAPIDRFACLFPRASFSFTAVYEKISQGQFSIDRIEDFRTG